MVRKEIIVPLAGRRLSQIRQAEVHELLDAVIDRPAPVLANHVLKTFKRMCAWAVGRGIIERSPCDGIKAPSQSPPPRSRARQ